MKCSASSNSGSPTGSSGCVVTPCRGRYTSFSGTRLHFPLVRMTNLLNFTTAASSIAIDVSGPSGPKLNNAVTKGNLRSSIRSVQCLELKTIPILRKRYSNGTRSRTILLETRLAHIAQTSVRDKDLEVLQSSFACRWKLSTNRMGPGKKLVKIRRADCPW